MGWIAFTRASERRSWHCVLKTIALGRLLEPMWQRSGGVKRGMCDDGYLSGFIRSTNIRTS